MSLHRVQNIFISDGTALPANDAAVTTLGNGDIGFFGEDGTALNPSGADTTATQHQLYIFQKNSSGKYKNSMRIPGRKITKYEGQAYTPATRCVWAIGYDRKLATGSIVANNDEVYYFSILFKNEKNLYSERPLFFGLSFQSAVTGATQSNIADQIVTTINNNTAVAVNVVAVKVGDGTGAYGLTGATNYGVEITSNLLTQFNTAYWENRVNFEVAVDPNYGFDTTTCTNIIRATPGSGTYQQVYNMENFDYGYEGAINRRLWPIPPLVYQASSTLALSGAVKTAATLPTGAVGITTGLDVVTMTDNTGLRAGEFVQIDSVEYEIKYLIGTTKIVLTAVATTTSADATTKVRYGYDMYVIEFENPHTTGGANVVAGSQQSVVIAVPAIDAAAADPFDATGDSADMSAGGIQIKAILNTYCASDPLDFAAIAL